MVIIGFLRHIIQYTEMPYQFLCNISALPKFFHILKCFAVKNESRKAISHPVYEYFISIRFLQIKPLYLKYITDTNTFFLFPVLYIYSANLSDFLRYIV